MYPEETDSEDDREKGSEMDDSDVGEVETQRIKLTKQINSVLDSFFDTNSLSNDSESSMFSDKVEETRDGGEMNDESDSSGSAMETSDTEIITIEDCDNPNCNLCEPGGVFLYQYELSSFNDQPIIVDTNPPQMYLHFARGIYYPDVFPEDVIRAVRSEQKGVESILNAYKFKKLCLEISNIIMPDMRWTDKACKAVQTAVEDYMITVFRGANEMAINSGRTHIRFKDIMLADKLINHLSSRVVMESIVLINCLMNQLECPKNQTS